MPFKVVGEVEWRMEERIWPTPWAMPFPIEPFGSPRMRMRTDDAKKLLECLKSVHSITDVFYIGGTLNFTASKIPEDDWEIILEELSE